MSEIQQRIERTVADLALFDDWAARYEYVISLGKKLPPLPPSARNEEHLIKGCQSQVWLDAHAKEGLIYYVADSDSLITKGLIALFIRVLDAQPAEAILTADLSFIERTGLKEHLAPTRANALGLMAAQMKQRALQLSTLP